MRQKWKKLAAAALSLAVLVCLRPPDASAAPAAPVAATYDLMQEGSNTSLQCAVGSSLTGDLGAGGLLTGMHVTIAEDGSASATLELGSGSTTVSGTAIQLTGWVDDTATPGYVNTEGTAVTEGVTYTTAEGESRITSLTFPLEAYQDSYQLRFHVTGAFSLNGNPLSEVNQTADATLTVDWDSANIPERTEDPDPADTTTGSTEVGYDYTVCYEVSIPASVTIDPATKTGAYVLEAKNFEFPEGGYVTVSATPAGLLTNTTDGNTISFTNTLDRTRLDATGDVLNGTVTATGTGKTSGHYQGTISFTINYFAAP